MSRLRGLRVWALVAALIALTPGRGSAGMISMCDDPGMFPDADVTVIVLPFEDHTRSSPAASGELADRESPVGTELAGLIQVDTLLAISGLGRVAAIRMVGRPADCQPELVVEQLRARYGAGRSDRAIVLVWGRIFLAGSEIYVQSYASFQRLGEEDPGEMIELPLGDGVLAAQLAAQTLTFAPRRVSADDLRLIRDRFATQNVVHDRPDQASPGAPLRLQLAPGGRLAYYVTEVEGDWIHIVARSGQQGWILAHALLGQQSLSARLPEMRFIEGVAGYFGFRAQPLPAKAQSADAALRAFEESPLSATTPEASAVSQQLRGLLLLLAQRQSEAAFDGAASLFERAAETLPASSAASNLAAVVAVYRDWRRDGRKVAYQQAVNRFWSSISANPYDRTALTNCWTMMQLARNPAFRERFVFDPALTDEDLARDQQDMEQVQLGGNPVRLAHAVPIVRWPAVP